MAKKELTQAGTIVNFMYFLHNHSGMFNIIEEVFEEYGENFVNHLKTKLENTMGNEQVCRPEHIVVFIINLSISYQIKFAEYVNEKYDSGFEQLRESK